MIKYFEKEGMSGRKGKLNEGFEDDEFSKDTEIEPKPKSDDVKINGCYYNADFQQSSNSIATIDNLKVKSDLPETNPVAIEIKKHEISRTLRLIVTVSNCLMCTATIGFLMGLGVLFVGIIDEFQTSRTEAAPMLSLFSAFLFGGGGAVGPLMNRFNGGFLCVLASTIALSGCILSFLAPSVPVLIFSNGVLTGIGCCIPFLLPYIMTGELFDKHKITAITVVSICPGIGAIIFPYLTAVLMDIYTWRGVFLIYGAVFFNFVPVGLLNAFVKRRLNRGKSVSTNLKDIFNCSVFRKPIYLVMVFCVFLMNTLFPTVNMFLVDMLRSKGFDVNTSSSLLSINGFSNVIGRILITFLNPFIKVSRIAQWSVYMGVCSSTLSFYVLATTYVQLLSTTIIHGFVWGMTAVSIPAMILEIAGTKRYASAMGYCNLIGGIGGLIGAPLAAMVKDSTGSYDAVYFTTTGMGLLAGLMLLFMYLRKRREKQDDEAPTPDKFRYFDS